MVARSISFYAHFSHHWSTAQEAPVRHLIDAGRRTPNCLQRKGFRKGRVGQREWEQGERPYPKKAKGRVGCVPCCSRCFGRSQSRRRSRSIAESIRRFLGNCSCQSLPV